MGQRRREFGLAVAQLGPIHLADSRVSVVARLMDLLRQGHACGATLVTFPELALTTFFARYWMDDAEADRFFEKTMPGPETQPLFDLAKKLGVGFYLGFAELTPAGRRFNTSILVDRSGTIVGRYRKVHLPGHADNRPHLPFQHLEKKYFEVGDRGFPVWDTLETRIGMCICNDRRWPETFRVMGLQSAEIVALGYNTPSINFAWAEPPHLRMSQHLLALQAGAYQNAVWVAAAAKAGSEDGFHLIGGSAIVAPTGEIVAQAQGEDDELLFVKADLSLADEAKAFMFNFERHREPAHYGLIVERKGAGLPLGDAVDSLA